MSCGSPRTPSRAQVQLGHIITLQGSALEAFRAAPSGRCAVAASVYSGRRRLSAFPFPSSSPPLRACFACLGSCLFESGSHACGPTNLLLCEFPFFGSSLFHSMSSPSRDADCPCLTTDVTSVACCRSFELTDSAVARAAVTVLLRSMNNLCDGACSASTGLKFTDFPTIFS